MKSVTTSIW